MLDFIGSYVSKIENAGTGLLFTGSDVFSGIIFLPGYLLNGWFELLPVGLAMVSRMEVSASMFFIR